MAPPKITFTGLEKYKHIFFPFYSRMIIPFSMADTTLWR